MREELLGIPPSERVLLLPHCLRPSALCPGRPTKDGFQCPPDCPITDCPIGILRKEAERLGYKGVCVAPGGALALRFVQEKKPKLVVAVACQKELLEGTEAVTKMESPPQVATLPLLRDGCVDTEVDLSAALELLREGISAG
ncbi:DUF116 domain-containing protein [Candidatus Bipolaricaulota bacterium]|nr:DUF116 domain-containing protein [Candidatus Bipolaricaulota bacterium]